MKYAKQEKKAFGKCAYPSTLHISTLVSLDAPSLQIRLHIYTWQKTKSRTR